MNIEIMIIRNYYSHYNKLLLYKILKLKKISYYQIYYFNR